MPYDSQVYYAIQMKIFGNAINEMLISHFKKNYNKGLVRDCI